MKYSCRRFNVTPHYCRCQFKTNGAFFFCSIHDVFQFVFCDSQCNQHRWIDFFFLFLCFNFWRRRRRKKSRSNIWFISSILNCDFHKGSPGGQTQHLNFKSVSVCVRACVFESDSIWNVKCKSLDIQMILELWVYLWKVGVFEFCQGKKNHNQIKSSEREKKTSKFEICHWNGETMQSYKTVRFYRQWHTNLFCIQKKKKMDFHFVDDHVHLRGRFSVFSFHLSLKLNFACKSSEIKINIQRSAFVLINSVITIKTV